MEPFKALTFLAVAAIVSLVGAGAAGFYAGYSAGRGNLEHLKAENANGPVMAGGSGGAVSLKPVLEDIRALSKQVESLAAAKTSPASSADQGSRPVLDEIKALSRQIDALRGGVQVGRSSEAQASSSQADHSGSLHEVREQLSALNTKLEKQDPKAPKALIDEIRLLGTSVQTQEPNMRRAIAEEVRNAVATIQNTEPKVNKALMDEIRTISANTRPTDRPQASVVDQVKILAASIESLKSRLSNEARGGGNEALGAEVAQLRDLVATASDQFGKCQMQLASLASAGAGYPQMQQPAPATTAVAVSQNVRPEPSTVVFYDNVMLKKDQEKQYDEIGVRLALQSIGPRQVRVAVNRQGFGLAFGERKVFRSQDVECELNLMETNLNDSQARVSISCKR
jgi:hypothetical protein